MIRLLFSIGFSVLSLLPTAAQVNKATHDEVKDSIVARFNRNDFKGIHQLADTAFTKNTTEERLIRFLKNNRNNGKIVRVISQSESKGMFTYRLEFEVRNKDMVLEVTPDKKFSSFGFVNLPPSLLDSAPPVKSNNPLKTELDRSIDSVARDYFRNPNAASLSIGIIKNGKPYSYYYGETQKGKASLPTVHTLYEIGSITKTFTATLLAQAVLDQKVALSDDIRRYLSGDFPNLSYNGQAITLLDLANHTARLPTLPRNIGDQLDYDPVTPFAGYDSLLFFKALREVKIDTLPGYKFEYSNWGIALLGHILENVYRQPYQNLLDLYITRPLGMKDTKYALTEAERNKVIPPYAENGRQVPAEVESPFNPAGGIRSSLADMLHYLKAQLGEREPAIKLTHQPTRNNMGLGWGVRKSGAYRDVQHNGSTLGFAANLTAFPELNSGCVIMVNTNASIGKLVGRVQSIVKKGNPQTKQSLVR